MARIVFLERARTDYQEIKNAFKARHSAARFQQFKQAFKHLYVDMERYPMAGVVPDEASLLGLKIRQRIVEQVRVIYQVEDETIYVHMFIPTQRDFLAHLTERLLRP